KIRAIDSRRRTDPSAPGPRTRPSRGAIATRPGSPANRDRGATSLRAPQAGKRPAAAAAGHGAPDPVALRGRGPIAPGARAGLEAYLWHPAHGHSWPGSISCCNQTWCTTSRWVALRSSGVGGFLESEQPHDTSHHARIVATGGIDLTDDVETFAHRLHDADPH